VIAGLIALSSSDHRRSGRRSEVTLTLINSSNLKLKFSIETRPTLRLARLCAAMRSLCRLGNKPFCPAHTPTQSLALDEWSSAHWERKNLIFGYSTGRGPCMVRRPQHWHWWFAWAPRRGSGSGSLLPAGVSKGCRMDQCTWPKADQQIRTHGAKGTWSPTRSASISTRMLIEEFPDGSFWEGRSAGGFCRFHVTRLSSWVALLPWARLSQSLSRPCPCGPWRARGRRGSLPALWR
jgi:hypothetical protein